MVVAPIDLSSHTTTDLQRQLETDGVVCLENVVAAAWLDAAVSAIPRYVAAHGNADFLVVDAGDEPGTPAWELVSSPELKALLAALGAAGHREAGNLSVLRSGLTVRTGADQPGPGNLFHYDASVLTMVVPIVIPSGQAGACGELVAIPNKRPFRRHLAAHAFDKLATHNHPYRKALADKALREPSTHIVDLRPGSAYLFWGYRTLHGNFSCAAGLQRVTLVIQFGEVHQPSLGLSLARIVTRRKLRRMRTASDTPIDGSRSTRGKNAAV